MTKMKRPKPLKAGDTIRIIAPAGKIEIGMLNQAIRLFNTWGLEVETGKHLFKSYNMFSATDEKRLEDLQDALNDKKIKAIICARGGYGTNRIIDNADFSEFSQNPKWIVGYSDITVLLIHIQKHCGLVSVHGIMPKNITGQEPDSSITSLKEVLFGGNPVYTIKGNPFNRIGEARGELTGGNLSILYSLTGTADEPDYAGKILFLEEVGEYHYHVDRMLTSLFRSGKLAQIKGIIIGDFTEIKDSEPGIGKSIYETIASHISNYNYPVVFGFPAGHSGDNRALMIGSEVEIKVMPEFAEIAFLSETEKGKQKFSLRRFLLTIIITGLFFALIWMMAHLFLEKIMKQ